MQSLDPMATCHQGLSVPGAGLLTVATCLGQVQSDTRLGGRTGSTAIGHRMDRHLHFLSMKSEWAK